MTFVETGNWVCHPWKEWKKLSAIRESKENLVASCRALSCCHFRRANRGRRWLDSRTTCWLWRTTTTPWRQNWTACSTWRWGTFTLSQQKTSPNSTLSFVLGVNSDHQGPLALIMLFVTYVYDLLSRTKAEARSLGAGTQPVVGEDVDRTLSKNQHILNIVPTSPQHPPHPHVLSTRIPRT